MPEHEDGQGTYMGIYLVQGEEIVFDESSGEDVERVGRRLGVGSLQIMSELPTTNGYTNIYRNIHHVELKWYSIEREHLIELELEAEELRQSGALEARDELQELIVRRILLVCVEDEIEDAVRVEVKASYAENQMRRWSLYSLVRRMNTKRTNQRLDVLNDFVDRVRGDGRTCARFSAKYLQQKVAV
jgi:hypothetical protein